MDEGVGQAAKARVKGAATRAAILLHVPVRRPVEVEALPADLLAEIRQFFSRPKFFVIGYPRSGTTLLARLLSLHPEVYCNYQAHFFTQAHSLAGSLAAADVAAWFERRDNRWWDGPGGPSALLRVACDFVLERQAAREGKRVVGDKSPDDGWAQGLETLTRIYPEARLIHIVRDGRDVAVSRRIQQMIDRRGTLGAADRRIAARVAEAPQDYLRAGGSLFTPRWLRREARRWATDVTLSDAKARERFGARYQSLRFEDLLEAPLEHMQALFEFLGVAALGREAETQLREEMGRNPAADWHAQQAPGLTSAVERGTAGGWRAVFTEGDRQVYQTLAGDALARLGYGDGA